MEHLEPETVRRRFEVGLELAKRFFGPIHSPQGRKFEELSRRLETWLAPLDHCLAQKHSKIVQKLEVLCR